MVSVPEAATRVAMLERGEADIMYFVPGELIDRVKNNPSCGWRRWCPATGGWSSRASRTRLTRSTTSACAKRSAWRRSRRDQRRRMRRHGRGRWQLDQRRRRVWLAWPKWPHDIAKAKRLMAESGYPNGFNVDWVTPAPNYYSRGERIVSQLQAIGIRSRLQVMERGVFLKKMQGGVQGMARHPDRIQCNAHRRHVVELVRHDVPLRRLQFQGFLLCQGPGRPVPQVPGLIRPRPNARIWRSRSSGQYWRTTISCRCFAMRSSTRSGRALWRRNGRTCFRPSPAATLIRRRTSSQAWCRERDGGWDRRVRPFSAPAICRRHYLHPEPDHLHEL